MSFPSSQSFAIENGHGKSFSSLTIVGLPSTVPVQLHYFNALIWQDQTQSLSTNPKASPDWQVVHIISKFLRAFFNHPIWVRVTLSNHPLLITVLFCLFQDENNCPLRVDQCAHGEADTVDVSLVHCNSVARDNGFVNQEEKMLFVFGQLPKSYYNQPPAKYCSQLLPLPVTSNPSQSGILYSPFKSVFANPSYNLIMCPGDQQCNLGSDPQEDGPNERNSSGYKPQGLDEICGITQTMEDLDSPMPCVSSYIILPK